MRVDDFDYELPDERIAVRPAQPRDAARLLVVGETLQDKTVRDLPALLRAGDVLVFNDTQVIPARLYGTRGAVAVEMLLHRRLDGATWEVFAKPAKRLRAGDVIDLAADFKADVMGRNAADGTVVLKFDRADGALFAALEQHGHMPLPPYIKRADDAGDRADYQTLFAAKEGAVAAPTASLHYTPVLLEALKAAGVRWVTLTLHVGAGTFLPVRVEDTRDHVMHAEWCELGAEAAAVLNAARAAGGRIIPVGTTALRTLESAADETGQLRAFSGETRLFITPGYKFKAADALLTNFHLPKSTLFMLVAAFCGLERMKVAYRHAIDAGYRFYSYGDTSLLFPEGLA